MIDHLKNVNEYQALVKKATNPESLLLNEKIMTIRNRQKNVRAKMQNLNYKNREVK